MSRGGHDYKRSKLANHWFSCVLFGLMLLAPGRIHGDNPKTRKHAPNVKESASELSSRNQSLLMLYSAEIETTADKIISGSPSPDARRQALIWKAEAIPVMQTALLNSDPIAAVLDTWAFIFQMTAFTERPEWKNVVGNFYPAVAETLRNMNVQMEQLVQSGAPKADLAAVRERVHIWAKAHPIQDSVASRQSAGADIIKNVGETHFGTFASVQVLAKSMGDLSARIDSYNLYLPKQARWQAELFFEDLKRDSQVNSALSDFKAISGASAKLDSQRLSIQEFVHQERLQTMEQVQQQRVGTFAALHAEVLGVTAALHAERLGATGDLRRERQAVLDALRDQVSTLRGASEKEIETVHTRGRDLIDHLFLRCVELMLLTLALGSLAAWILLRRLYTKPRVRVERPLHRAA